MSVVPDGIAGTRWAVAKAAGWEWCDEHQRTRWRDVGSCRHLHVEQPDPAAPIWCVTCERMHGPMDWGDGCLGWDELPHIGHHRTKREVAPGAWEVARPLRDTSWWHRWKRERACRRETGHCWHPDGFVDWWCCMCSGETDGMPAQRCTRCAPVS